MQGNYVQNVMSYKSVKDVVTMLLENGFVLKSQKGKMCIRDRVIPVTVIIPVSFSFPVSSAGSGGVAADFIQGDFAALCLSLIHI